MIKSLYFIPFGETWYIVYDRTKRFSSDNILTCNNPEQHLVSYRADFFGGPEIHSIKDIYDYYNDELPCNVIITPIHIAKLRKYFEND